MALKCRPHGLARSGGETGGRRTHTMRSTDDETTRSAYDISLMPHAAVPSPTPPTEDGAARPPAGASDTGEQVGQAHAIHHARAVAQAAPEVRLARVGAARRALQEGTLTLDGQAVAAKLLQAVRTERRHP